MKITHQKDKCMGCLACATACEKYFGSDENGLAHLKGSKKNSKTGNYELECVVASKDKQALEDAESVCPVHIIHLEG
jgi:ferredoxin